MGLQKKINPSISASVVLYNNDESQVRKTILSLYLSELITEIIIFDNSNCAWAEGLTNEKIKYIRSPVNLGYSKGHNHAVASCNVESDYILICNPDIYFDSIKFDQFVFSVFDKSYDLIMPNILNEDGTRQELCKLLPTPLNLFSRRFIPRLADRLDYRYLLRFADYTQDFFCPSLSGCFMLIKHTTWNKVQGFDPNIFMYLEDIDISRRIAREGNVFYTPTMDVYHGFQKESYRSFRLLVRHIKSAIYYFNKWGWFIDSERNNLNNKCLKNLPMSSDNNAQYREKDIAP